MRATFSHSILLTAAFISSLPWTLQAEDWPHWLGVKGDNIAIAEKAFSPNLEKWSVAWKTNVGRGNSSVTIADGRAYTMGHDAGSNEVVFCFDALSGRVLWRQSYEAKLVDLMHPGGPSSTPTVFGDQVITVSKDGQVHSFNKENGAELWQANLDDILGIKLPMWGYACSPVVTDGHVLFSSGKVAELDLDSGRVIWTTTNAYSPAYTTPVVFERGKKKYIAALDSKGLSILNTDDGTEIARHPFSFMHDVGVSTPFVLDRGRRIFISGNASSEMLAFDGKGLSSVWKSTELKNSLNNSVIFDGALYGIDEPQGQARFVSLNLKSGKLNWAQTNFSFGNVVGVGKTVLAATSEGELVAIKPSKKGYAEISRLQVVGETCYAPPTYANQRIYVRNSKGDLACLAPGS